MRRLGQIKKQSGWTAAVLLLTLLPTYGCKGDQEVVCSRTEGAIVVDGLMADWEELPTTYLEDQGVVMGLSNDDDHLYFMFRFRDEKWARTIRMSGLTLWLDSRGEKGKDFTLKYRGGPKLSELMPKNENVPEEMRERTPRRDTAMTDELTCAVKDRLVEMPIPLDGANGPKAAFGTDHGFYVYEFMIPLKDSEVRYYGLGAEAGAKITIGANWGKMEMGGRGQRPGGGQRGGPPGGGGGMGGGRSGGGMGGGPPGGMGGQRPEMPEEQEIWIKTKLATTPAETE